MSKKTKLYLVYPAIFTPETNGGYLIEFPDIQGAFTGINTDNISYGIEMADRKAKKLKLNFSSLLTNAILQEK